MEDTIMNQILVKFVKMQNRSGRRIGAVVAINPKQIGWSLCRKNDKFDPDRAIEIALARAEHGTHIKTPQSLSKYVYEMQDRATRYYK